MLYFFYLATSLRLMIRVIADAILRPLSSNFFGDFPARGPTARSLIFAGHYAKSFALYMQLHLLTVIVIEERVSERVGEGEGELKLF